MSELVKLSRNVAEAHCRQVTTVHTAVECMTLYFKIDPRARSGFCGRKFQVLQQEAAVSSPFQSTRCSGDAAPRGKARAARSKSADSSSEPEDTESDDDEEEDASMEERGGPHGKDGNIINGKRQHLQ